MSPLIVVTLDHCMVANVSKPLPRETKASATALF